MSSTTTSNIKRNTTAPKMFYKFEHSCRNIPHPEKQWKGGEDAYFAHDNILVVADGVGGWAEFGIDASLYSKKLVQLIYENFYSDKQPLYIQQPSQLIQDSVAMNKQLGSSTICVIVLEPHTGTLRAAYLGDTIFSIYRNHQEILAIPQLQHKFNRPYQVGVEGDDPASAMRINRQLSPGDTLVVATDGVWDNLHKKNIEYIVANSATMEEAAEFISLQSYRQSSLTDFKSPFYEKAISSGQTCTPSGKPDDITVITARVVQTPAF